MVSTKDLCFFILLSLLCVVNLDANLLPDTLVRTGSYTFSNVEALEFGDSLLSVNDNYNDNNLQCVLDRARVVQKKLMPSYVNRVTKLELVSSSGRRGYLYIGKKQRFYRWNALAELKPKLLKHVKEKNREFLEILLRVIWVKAKDLKKGDKLLGLNNDVVTVIKVKTIELEESIDSYDLSLTWPHTFFVVDSSGNSLLTHNITSSIAKHWKTILLIICKSWEVYLWDFHILGGRQYSISNSKRSGQITSSLFISSGQRGFVCLNFVTTCPKPIMPCTGLDT